MSTPCLGKTSCSVRGGAAGYEDADRWLTQTCNPLASPLPWLENLIHTLTLSNDSVLTNLFPHTTAPHIKLMA